MVCQGNCNSILYDIIAINFYSSNFQILGTLTHHHTHTHTTHMHTSRRGNARREFELLSLDKEFRMSVTSPRVTLLIVRRVEGRGRRWLVLACFVYDRVNNKRAR